MKFVHSSKPYPNLRFRNLEDAKKAMESIKLRQPFDWSLCIGTYIEVDGKIEINKKYMDAPYEITLVEFEEGDNEIVDCKTTP